MSRIHPGMIRSRSIAGAGSHIRCACERADCCGGRKRTRKGPASSGRRERAERQQSGARQQTNDGRTTGRGHSAPYGSGQCVAILEHFLRAASQDSARRLGPASHSERLPPIHDDCGGEHAAYTGRLPRAALARCRRVGHYAGRQGAHHEP